MTLPIQITEVQVDENWEPDTRKQYIIEYEWKKGDIWWLIGRFHPVWYGYTFDWPWSASSLQLSIAGRIVKISNDWKQFKRVYIFEPYPEPDFIRKEELNVQ
jgi:hypothetical protein